MSMLKSTLKNLFSRPVTVLYPTEKADIPDTNRGRVVWEMKKCIWCRLCEKNCPTMAITTDKALKTQTIVRARCIACNTCVEVCPTNTISMEPKYSEAVYLRETHVYDLALKPFEYRVIQTLPSERVILRKRPGEPEVAEEASPPPSEKPVQGSGST
ncbi:MAG TPA: 4Fe-4S dicluster domain-containing protein [Methanomassiliicoccales archaeon]|jgi:formate hydrogenlyase subunit 6/NADH:ubiquinone oxidoreductase subunit I